MPRFVNHIDEKTIEAITSFYEDYLVPGSAFVDLMSSWVSHLPISIKLKEVVGLGLNNDELICVTPPSIIFEGMEVNPSPQQTLDSVK